jgi:hypothetical protein
MTRSPSRLRSRNLDTSALAQLPDKTIILGVIDPVRPGGRDG